MAWPLNIAPQTPSAQYDIVNIQPLQAIYVQLINNTYATVIIGAKSRCRIDLPLYDQSTERDIIDASFIGRGGVSIISQTGAVSVIPLSADVVLPDEPITVPPDSILTTMQDSDNITHTPNHQLVLGTTIIRWYDGLNATGNLVGEVDAARYVSSGGSPPKGVF